MMNMLTWLIIALVMGILTDILLMCLLRQKQYPFSVILSVIVMLALFKTFGEEIIIIKGFYMLSDRIQTLSPSLTIAISSLARDLKAQGKDILSFSAGEPDFGTPKRIKDEAIKAIGFYTTTSNTNISPRRAC